MLFRTEIPIVSQQFLSYEKRFLLLGSCFAETIGSRLLRHHFLCDLNPFGVLYNPLSMAQALERLRAKKIFSESELFQHNDLWHSWLHHGSFSDISSETTLEKINKRLAEAAENFEKSDILVLTFGSSWVYEKGGKVVANCHKVPEKEFVRRRLTVDEIVSFYTPLLSSYLTAKNGRKVIISVSPIRYLRNGATENQTNKAILLLAAEALAQQFADVIYFPSYEIVLDELRDYRFFADDMIHISEKAAEYVWERFCAAFFTKETVDLLPKVAKIEKMLQHRPLNAYTAEYARFLEQTQQEINAIKQKYPHINI